MLVDSIFRAGLIVHFCFFVLKVPVIFFKGVSFHEYIYNLINNCAEHLEKLYMLRIFLKQI